ncbi:protein shuttle craft-like [Ctenocephalides felis]|uniref:protein shuttle craft-like n=1 Tax=Ctenocephalides felis TaxID=7515 RepID=UPI000E6E13D1|nr:protein shuttle craft-like [Ctenocephalides felis]
MMRKTIPCHQKDFSCGRPCGKELPCGKHSCLLPCHKGACLQDGKTCSQPCATPRSSCNHPCRSPCHEGICPDTPCKEKVLVSCQCKLRSTTRTCSETSRDYQRIASSLLASKMAEMQRGATIDIQDILNNRNVNLKT